MIYIVCTACRTALCISGELDETEHLFGTKSPWFPDKYPCPTCREPAQNVDFMDHLAMKTMEVHALTPQEAFAALNGLGLPEEQECGPVAVQKVFDDNKVTKVNAKLMKGTNRSVLDSLEFEDGTRMFFGVSPSGPTIYRIARRHSYTQEVLDEQG